MMMHRTCGRERNFRGSGPRLYNVDSPTMRVNLLRMVPACLEVNRDDIAGRRTDRHGQLKVLANEAAPMLSFIRAPRRRSTCLSPQLSTERRSQRSALRRVFGRWALPRVAPAGTSVRY
ncbi:hypothetical protein K523DRAFT_107662 [Schizophyllum commune Tattone D]|nr:hypothetical protein K523DRAFT_107662 [Schizophyllum commune Tattone D]